MDMKKCRIFCFEKRVGKKWVCMYCGEKREDINDFILRVAEISLKYVQECFLKAMSRRNRSKEMGLLKKYVEENG